MHLMIDLETLGTKQNSVIAQIGFAQFELTGSDVLSRGCIHLDIQEQLNFGRKVDWSTIKWWLEQDEAARTILRSTERLGLGDAKAVFATFPWSEIEGVWGHGATFDISMLENIYQQFGESPPWNFRAPRDTRTLFSLMPDMKMEPFGVAHSAVDDAIAQALHVQKVYKAVQALHAQP